MNIIMILTNAFSLDVRVYKEAKYLLSQGHSVEILCWDKTPEKGLPAIDEYDNIQIRRIGIPSLEGSGYRQLGAYAFFVKHCRHYLRNTNYDVLHCHDMDGAIVGSLMGSKFIFDMHEFYDKGGRARGFLSHHIVRRLAKRAVANIYVSKSNVLVYGKGIEGKFYQLKNYSDRSMFQRIDKTQSSCLRIAYIGRVRNQIKEFTALFDAVKGVDNVRVDIYGDGPDLEQIQSMAVKQKNVIVHGAYNGVNDSEEIYRNTDISFVAYDPANPNYQGEFEPVKLYEAIITGTPIIATKDINPGKIVVQKGIGIAVDTRSSDEVGAAIQILLDDKEAMPTFRRNMRLIADQYDWNEAVKILDKVYKAI